MEQQDLTYIHTHRHTNMNKHTRLELRSQHYEASGIPLSKYNIQFSFNFLVKCISLPPLSLTLSLTHSLAHQLTHSHTHSLTPPPLTQSLTHLITLSLNHSITHTLPHLPSPCEGVHTNAVELSAPVIGKEGGEGGRDRQASPPLQLKKFHKNALEL